MRYKIVFVLILFQIITSCSRKEDEGFDYSSWFSVKYEQGSDTLGLIRMDLTSSAKEMTFDLSTAYSLVNSNGEVEFYMPENRSSKLFFYERGEDHLELYGTHKNSDDRRVVQCNTELQVYSYYEDGKLPHYSGTPFGKFINSQNFNIDVFDEYFVRFDSVSINESDLSQNLELFGDYFSMIEPYFESSRTEWLVEDTVSVFGYYNSNDKGFGRSNLFLNTNYNSQERKVRTKVVNYYNVPEDLLHLYGFNMIQLKIDDQEIIGNVDASNDQFFFKDGYFEPRRNEGTFQKEIVVMLEDSLGVESDSIVFYTTWSPYDYIQEE